MGARVVLHLSWSSSNGKSSSMLCCQLKLMPGCSPPSTQGVHGGDAGGAGGEGGGGGTHEQMRAS